MVSPVLIDFLLTMPFKERDGNVGAAADVHNQVAVLAFSMSICAPIAAATRLLDQIDLCGHPMRWQRR